MENNENNDQNEHQFRRAVSLEPKMSSSKEATGETAIQMNLLSGLPKQEKNSSLRRHVSEPAHNHHKTVSNVVTRAESIKSMFVRGTQQFFGISEDQNSDAQIWHQRGRRLLQRHGKIKENEPRSLAPNDVNTGFDEIDGQLENNRMNGFSGTQQPIKSDTAPEGAIRKSALSVTFKAIALASNTLKKKISKQNKQKAEEPIEEEEEDQSIPFDSFSSGDEEDEDFFTKKVESPHDEVDAPKHVNWRIHRQVSVRDQTLPEKLFQTLLNIDNSNRRELGMGLIDKLLNLKTKKNMTKEERMAIEDHNDDFRPYFTYWISTVQILILIITVIVYSIAPFGTGLRHQNGLVFVKSASYQQVDFIEMENFWIGPRSSDLIHLGAKYTPCMRRDDRIYKVIEEERTLEKYTGCCIRNDGSGCAQISKDKCSPLLSVWHKWKSSDTRTSGPVCGQDPKNCQQPASIEPYEWADDITKWPICLKKSIASAEPHMNCEILGRPCCLGVSGQCSITTREHCDFLHGFFHEEATLCSQVSCMENVCGMIPFYSTDSPNQFYRILTPIFLHAGFVHFGISLIFQLFIMRDIEKMIGPIRMSIIYMVSGIGGYLASAVFLPFRPEVGPAGAHYGVLACLFVEFINISDIKYEKPLIPILKLSGVAIFLLILGFLPWIDNYAHFFGLIIGFFLSLAILPDVVIPIKPDPSQQHIDQWKRRRNLKIIQIIICLTIVFLILIILFIMLYMVPIYDIKLLKYLNCIPLTPDWCSNQDIQISRIDIL